MLSSTTLSGCRSAAFYGGLFLWSEASIPILSAGHHDFAYLMRLAATQPTLTNLGIKMDTNVANDIMMEKVGVAPKLLYAIKSHVEGLTNNLAATRTTKLGSIFGAETMPTAKLVESQRFRTEKANKDTGDLKCVACSSPHTLNSPALHAVRACWCPSRGEVEDGERRGGLPSSPGLPLRASGAAGASTPRFTSATSWPPHLSPGGP